MSTTVAIPLLSTVCSPGTDRALILNHISPYLATYLGHKDINSTLVYLTITQELLQQASERFRVQGAQILRGSTGGENA